MSLLNDDIQLRNDTGSPISIGALSIAAAQVVTIWDSKNYSLADNNDLSEVVNNYNDFALNISQSNVVLIKNTVDLGVVDAFKEFIALKDGYDGINQAKLIGVALRKIKAIPSYVLGEVRVSLLSESQFNDQVGSGWALANGQSVSGTPYSVITGKSTVPDMRGQFLRGKNHGRSDGYEDPEGERDLGEYQADSFETHQHDYNDSGQDTSGLTAGGVNYASATDSLRQTESDTDGGSDETRPKNISVNYFVYVGIV